MYVTFFTLILTWSDLIANNNFKMGYRTNVDRQLRLKHYILCKLILKERLSNIHHPLKDKKDSKKSLSLKGNQ